MTAQLEAYNTEKRSLTFKIRALNDRHKDLVIIAETAHKAIKVTDDVRLWIKKLLRQELSPQQVADYLREHKKASLPRCKHS